MPIKHKPSSEGFKLTGGDIWKQKKLTQIERVELGFNPRSVERMIEREAILINGVVLAPVEKRSAKSKK